MAVNDRVQEYRLKELERKMTGLQRQVGVLNAKHENTKKDQEQRIRNLEIKAAVQQGVSQKKVAQIYDLSPGRVSQIVKRVA